MKIEKKPKKERQDLRSIPEAETIEVRKLASNPDGFPYAVLRGAQVMGWLRNEVDANRLVWSMQLIDLLKEELSAAFIDSVFFKLKDLREK